jgi:colanic acid/amylovoran biosynthesis glycosyltransferase
MHLSPRAREMTSNLPVVCVAHPNRNSYSETFIRAHIDKLPARVLEVCDGWFPTYFAGNGTLFPAPLAIALRKASALPTLLAASLKALASLRFALFLRRNQVAAVLAEYGPTGVELAAACRRAGIPLIVHFHGLDAYAQPVLDTYTVGYRQLFQHAVPLIVPSLAMKQQLVQLGGKSERITVLPYGIDTARFAAADPAGAQPHFVAVGRFVEKKAPHLTLLAFQQVAITCPEAHLTMIGDGPLWNVCKQIARALGLEQQVTFAGPRSHREVAETMGQARAFVQHSIRAENGDSEGTPVAILEAGAAGLPVVSTRHGGICDAVQEGVTGLLVDEGDMQGMAAAMLRLAQEPALAGELGSKAAQRARAEFEQHQQIARLWSIITEAMREVRR